MPKILQLRRGTTAQLDLLLGAAGEIFVNTSLSTVVVHTGLTTGGTTLAIASNTSVSIGRSAGINNQGTAAIALGAFAGFDNQCANSIIVNATGSALNSVTSNALYIAPVRVTSFSSNLVYYNPVTREMSYNTSVPTVVGVKETVLTTSTGTFTTDSKCIYAEVIVTGGGAGGGGSDSDGSSASAAGGGGAGGTAIARLTKAQLGATCTYTIGAGGTAGAVTGGNGGNGGVSTFVLTGTSETITGSGGGGGIGTGSAYGNTNSAFAGGAGGGASGGDVNQEGENGLPGIGSSGPSMTGGQGGNSYFGTGANAPTLNVAGAMQGVNATQGGAGGSGGINSNATGGVLGGLGYWGKINIVEYISA